MAPPLIGITTKRQQNKYGFPEIAIAETYPQAVLRAGGMPVLIPLGMPEERIRQIVGLVDGIIFSGGGDIEPGEYGSEMTEKVHTVDSDRDRVEIQLVGEVVEDGKPFLGICRGIQVINVAFGGTLYRDILEEHPNAIEHTYYPDWPWDHLAHNVDVQAGSVLADILGSTDVPVNSLHHQAIRQVASDLVPIAYAPDGIVEGVMLPEHPFGLAVQWHPEWLPEHKPMRALFQAFVDAANSERKA